MVLNSVAQQFNQPVHARRHGIRVGIGMQRRDAVCHDDARHEELTGLCRHFV
jgi:hypothetical protein